jgi:DNA-binding beta-propeller fold protein YncE
MKRRLFALVVLCVMLAFCLQVSAQDADLGGFYYSSYFHLFFEYPKDWFIVEGSGGVQVLNFEYDNDGPNAPGEARVQFLTSGVLTQAGMNLNTSSPVAFLDDIRLIVNVGDNTQSEAAAIMLGDRPAARADGVFRGNKTMYLAVGTTEGEMLFISGEASDADFATYEPLFLQIAATGVYKLPTFADPLPPITRDNVGDMMRYFEFNSTRISNGQTEQVVFSPDGTLAANLVGFVEVQVWDTATGDLLNSFNVISASQIAFSPDNRKIAAVDFDAGLQIIDRNNGQVTAVPSDDRLLSVAYSPDGALIATGGRNGTVQLWNADAVEIVETLAQSEGAPIARVKFSPDGRWLAATGAAGTVSLWDMENGKAQTDFTVWDDPTERGVALAFSQDGTRLAVLAESGNYAVLDTATGEVILSGTLGESVFFEGIALNNDGSVLAVILQEDGIIALIDVSNGRTWARLSQGGDAVGSIAFSPDGAQLLAGGFYRNTLVLWAVGED